MSGRGTAGGIVFQGRVGACVAALILTERPLSRLGESLPGNPRKVLFEVSVPVDDCLVQTDVGEVFFQAKRTLTLSSAETSELRKVADQFVRQCIAGVVVNGIRRDLDVSKDRLVIAVSEEAAATVSADLREALARSRTGAATDIPAKQTKALKIFSDHIDAAWLDAKGAAITDAERQSILRLCSVTELGPSHRSLSEEALRDVVATPGDEVGLFDILEAWGSDGSARGTGGDSAAIRAALAGKANLAAPPSYRDDVERLAAYSDRMLARLEKFGKLEAPEGPITIPRPVAQAAQRAAAIGSLVVTGEPGAGKSAVLYELAVGLARTSPVIAFSVDAGAITLDALRSDICLTHPLVDVLRQIPGDRPAYLVLDALDASRGGSAEATYRKLIELVAELPGWHVIASVRTFDLRLGREWKRLFVGNPPEPGFASRDFPAVRHVHVSLLTNDELQNLQGRSPTVEAAIQAGGSKLEALARNPFNLNLLADLLASGTTAAALATITTRSQLLERYWDERISDLGLPATTGLKSVVEAMVVRRSTELPETSVNPAVASTIQELQRLGVLVTETTNRIAFRHHVLFDYAVARLILIPDQASARPHLAKNHGAGLLIAPSLAFWIEGLKGQISAAEFWRYVCEIITDPDVDPIVRVEVSRLAVESVDAQDNLAPLSALIATPNGAKAIPHFVGSLQTRANMQQDIVGSPWARLAASVAQPSRDILGSMRGLIGILLDAGISEEDRSFVGRAARTLMASIDIDLAGWLSPHVITFVAKTYETDPAESRARLEALFEPERFSKVGHAEVPWLAREVRLIAAADQDFAVQIFERVFLGGEFKSDQVTAMSNSWILSMTSNAAQDFGMAAHALSADFPKILAAHPRAGVRALAVTLRAVQQAKHPTRPGMASGPVETRDGTVLFEEDWSSTWAWDIDEDRYDDHSKIFKAFIDWVPSADAKVLDEVSAIVLSETGIGLAWRALFEAGALRPEALKASLQFAITNPQLLLAIDTRASLIRMVAAMWPHLSNAEREAAEQAWLAMDFSGFENPERAKLEIVGTILTAIGRENLSSTGAQENLAAAVSADVSLANERPFAVRTTWGGRHRHWLEHEGVDIDEPTTASLLALSDGLKQAGEAYVAEATPDGASVLWDATRALMEGIDADQANILPLVDAEVSDRLATALGQVLAAQIVPEESKNVALERLLKLTEHSDPISTPEIEERFAESPSWGSPAPRIAATKALVDLIRVPGFWERIKERFEHLLLHDPHPAVRMQLAVQTFLLHEIDLEAMWCLMESVAQNERNVGVLAFAAASFWSVRNVDPERIEKIAILLIDREPASQRSESRITSLIIHFAFARNFQASKDAISGWTKDYVREERRLTTVLSHLRDDFVAGFDGGDGLTIAIRNKAYEFAWQLIESIEPAVIAWPLRGGEPTEEEKAALQLFAHIADEIFYAAGHGQGLPSSLESLKAQQAFLDQAAPLISKLMTLGTPRAVHHLLELLNDLIPANPELCFDLFSEAMLRTTGVAKYEYESMGAKLFVDFVGRYLADYRPIFENDERRRRLIECIAVFVEAGWPEARRLFQALPELLA